MNISRNPSKQFLFSQISWLDIKVFADYTVCCESNNLNDFANFTQTLRTYLQNFTQVSISVIPDTGASISVLSVRDGHTRVLLDLHSILQIASQQIPCPRLSTYVNIRYM